MKREIIERLEIAFRVADAGTADTSLKQVKREIGRFLMRASAKGPGAETGGVWVGSRLPDVSDREAGNLRATVRRVLDGLVHGRPMDFPNVPRLMLVLSLVNANPKVVVQVVDGSASHRFVFALMLLLAHVGPERVRACPNCAGAFLKVGRRKYCRRPECRSSQRSAYWQKYKVTPKGRAAKKRLYQHLYKTIYAKNGWTPGARTPKRRAR